jgi:hypothetical protein
MCTFVHFSGGVGGSTVIFDCVHGRQNIAAFSGKSVYRVDEFSQPAKVFSIEI